MAALCSALEKNIVKYNARQSAVKSV